MAGALRIVITWLLAAALPLQGSAAASMALCSSTSAHDSVQGHGGSHHESGGNAEVAAKCSICAACCASMAIAVADFKLGLAASSESFVSPIGTGAPPFFTEGLERPPRTSSFA